MEKMVYELALKGDVASLKRLLDKDDLILERSMVCVYSDTALHVSAMLGYEDFANEILRRKPELAKELNANKSSPLHLAAAMGHTSVVRALLKLAGRGMCKVRDREGLTPFHLAAVKGRVEVLKELMSDDGHEICSSELSEVMGKDVELLGESILHMCVKHGQLESLKFLVEMIGGDADFVNSKDAHGNTVLHVAVENKQFEAVKFLVQGTGIQVSAENRNGLTAMDTLLLQTRNNYVSVNVKEMEIEEVALLRRDKEAAKQSQSNNNNNNKQSLQSKSSEIKKQLCCLFNKKDSSSKYKQNPNKWGEEMRAAIMVVASLLAAMSFQAATTVLQEMKDNKNIINLSDQKAPAPSDFDKSYYFASFILFNTMSFVVSLSVIQLLISGLHLYHRFFMYVMMITMWLAVSAAATSYILSLYLLLPKDYLYIGGSMDAFWTFSFIIIVVVIGAGYIIKLIRCLSTALKKKKKKRKKNNSNSEDMEIMEGQV